MQFYGTHISLGRLHLHVWFNVRCHSHDTTFALRISLSANTKAYTNNALLWTVRWLGNMPVEYESVKAWDPQVWRYLSESWGDKTFMQMRCMQPSLKAAINMATSSYLSYKRLRHVQLCHGRLIQRFITIAPCNASCNASCTYDLAQSTTQRQSQRLLGKS